VAVVRDDIKGVDDIWMLESRTNTELGGDLFLIFLF
jgi:hypothetical protein